MVCHVVQPLVAQIWRGPTAEFCIGSSIFGLGETDRVRSDDDDDDDVKDDLVGMIFFVSCSVFLFVLLVLVVIAVMYGQTIIASI